MNEYTIDAKGRKLGRVATEAARVLRGKDSVSFNPREARSIKVRIQNASKLSLEERKLRGKIYVSYTGYPGGLKKESLGSRIGKAGTTEPLREAIKGMLPATKLRSALMKNLIIEA
jgi:large subunit ribosomal protein L13